MLTHKKNIGKFIFTWSWWFVD